MLLLSRSKMAKIIKALSGYNYLDKDNNQIKDEGCKYLTRSKWNMIPSLRNKCLSK